MNLKHEHNEHGTVFQKHFLVGISNKMSYIPYLNYIWTAILLGPYILWMVAK